MKDNYTPDQIEEIIKVAQKWDSTPERVRQYLDEYYDETFEQAIDSVRDSLALRRDEMIAEGEMDDTYYS